MSVVSVAQIKEQLAFTDDVGELDDALLTRKISAAEAHIERLMGWRFADRFGGADQPPTPPADLVEAVCQLAAWWYENREAGAEAVRELPFGVRELINEHRDWTF